MAYQPIENYAIIGDLHTVALVGMDGSIDFLPFPRFDSPTVFAALLDHRKGGRFKIAPAFADARQKQLYLPDTNVLLTRSLSSEGVAEVTDFMPIEEEGHPHALIRHVTTVRGDVRFRMRFEPRFDYARAGHRFEVNPGEVLFLSSGSDRTALRLRTPVPVRMEHGAAIAEFELRAGESLDFVLEEARPGCESGAASPEWCMRMLEETTQYWRRWVGRSRRSSTSSRACCASRSPSRSSRWRSRTSDACGLTYAPCRLRATSARVHALRRAGAGGS